MAAKDIEKHQIKKGQVLNPKGRPKKLPHLEELLADILGEDKEGITAAEAILRALRAKATKGDIRAAEVLLERAYGKAKQGIELSGPNSEPIQIIINDKL
jgi:hypothetical protein